MEASVKATQMSCCGLSLLDILSIKSAPVVVYFKYRSLYNVMYLQLSDANKGFILTY